MIIDKGARDATRHRRPVFYYHSAREGFRDFLSNLRAPADAGVLLPAFIGWSPREGSGVFDPVQSLGLPAAFYPLNRDLTVDVPALARILEGGHYRALVLIHYYGRTDPQVARVRDLALAHGIPLIEDLAHGFFSAVVGGLAGSYGQAALYSLHKMLPMTDGGLVVYADSTFVYDQRSTAPGLAADVLAYDWQAIARARKANFDLATALLQDLIGRRMDLELVWPHLADGDVPQTLPVYVPEDVRDATYERMNARGYGVVSLYHTLIDGLAQDFPGSAQASARILNLPVHQDVAPGSLIGLVDELESCLIDLAGGPPR